MYHFCKESHCQHFVTVKASMFSFLTHVWMEGFAFSQENYKLQFSDLLTLNSLSKLVHYRAEICNDVTMVLFLQQRFSRVWSYMRHG